MKINLVPLVFLLILLSACSVTPVASESLNGTSWELYAISKHRPIEGTTLTIIFEDGRASGSAGCNSYGSMYQINGRKITFNEVSSTVMACLEPDGVMEQEQLFLQYLGKGQRFEIVDGQLQIYWSDHEALTFIPVD